MNNRIQFCVPYIIFQEHLQALVDRTGKASRFATTTWWIGVIHMTFDLSHQAVAGCRNIGSVSPFVSGMLRKL